MKNCLLLFIAFLYCVVNIYSQEDTSSYESFTYVEKMPSFPEGQAAMYKYIYQNIQYPELARFHKKSGQVIVQFVITKEGEITNTKVIRGLGYGLDEEAIRVVESMNNGHKWNPGMHNGRAVPVTFTLPIKFVLQSERKP